jgi:hypothetical protein
MHGTSDAGTRYLSLALLTRGAMNNLKGVTRGEPVGDDLSAALGRLLAGLRSQPAGSFLMQLQAASSAEQSSFEELATLTSLRTEFERANVAEVFSSVLQESDPLVKGESAKKLIRFLGEVESKALHYYSRAVQQPAY